jgi:hypothetical protein
MSSLTLSFCPFPGVILEVPSRTNVVPLGRRPIIPPELESSDFAPLMRLCWQSDPDARPPLSAIISTLDDLGGTRSARALSYAACTLFFTSFPSPSFF